MTAKEQVYKFVQSGKYKSVRTAAKQLDLSFATVHKYIQILQAEGKIAPTNQSPLKAV